MKLNYTILSLLFSISIFAQDAKNIELVSIVPNEITGNDVWGFEHSNGVEFAIMGDDNSTRIFSLENPANPTLIADIEGTNSPWRDIKNFGNYLYVVADRGQDGVLIIDLNTYTDDIPHKFFRPGFDQFNGDTLNTCHNIFINEDGFAYLSGCNIGERGIIIYDLNEDPWNPTYAGIANLRYSHDVFVRDTFMYTSEIYEGQFGVYSVADKSNPTLLATNNTPNLFTHNAWSSDDDKLLFTTDERGESFVGAYDISNLSDIKFLDKYKPVEGVGAIPHNTHFLDNYIITSWYTEGVIICDVSRPENIIEVGYYDTFQGQSGGFSGCWGAYPYLPSGLLLASDRQNGLFVLQPTLVRATYLEGVITDSETGSPLSGATVKIMSEDRNNEITDGQGIFKTGQCTPGEFQVSISHPDYNDTIITVNLVSTEVTELNLTLNKIPIYNLTLQTMSSSGEMLEGVDIAIQSVSQDYKSNSGEVGETSRMIQQGAYKIIAGKWGYKQLYMENISVTGNETIQLILKPGYGDDFIFDMGWESTGISSSGQWVRGEPIGTFFDTIKANVDIDLPFDIGNSCYVTGNAGGQGGTDDVDDGEVVLTSRIIDLSDFEDPYLHYSTWFVNAGGDSLPNDSLNIFIFDGKDSLLLETIKSENENGEWIQSDFALSGLVDSSSIQLIIIAQDDTKAGHIVEAGFDGFSLTEGETSSDGEPEIVNVFNAYPNPVNDRLTLVNREGLDAKGYSIYDLHGRLILKGTIGQKETNISTKSLTPGTYFINLFGDEFRQSIKIIKI